MMMIFSGGGGSTYASEAHECLAWCVDFVFLFFVARRLKKKENKELVQMLKKKSVNNHTT